MTIDAAFVATLSRWLDATDIDQLELSGPEGTLALGRASVARVAPAAPVEVPAAVRAPSLGLLLDRHPLAADPLVEVGDAVAAGDILACLQVGALLMAVRAPRAGIVAACLAAPGTLVGYGTPLFQLHPLPDGDGA